MRNRDGKAPIMVKISIDGDDKALGTKLFVTPDLWENGKAKGKSAEATEINGQLKEVSARLTNHYHRILREEDFVTAENATATTATTATAAPPAARIFIYGIAAFFFLISRSLKIFSR